MKFSATIVMYMKRCIQNNIFMLMAHSSFSNNIFMLMAHGSIKSQ